MWIHGIFGSQGMIWWWILRVIYLLAPAIQILPASQVYDWYSSASLLLGSFAQACIHKISSLPTDLPPTSFQRSNLLDSHWSRRSGDISQSSPHKRTLFRSIANVQHSAGQTLPLTKGLGQIILLSPPPFFFRFFLCKRKLFKLPLGTDYYLVNTWVCFTSMSGLLWCLVTWVLGWVFSSAACAFVKYLWAP
jgi:hypothetical protein